MHKMNFLAILLILGCKITAAERITDLKYRDLQVQLLSLSIPDRSIKNSLDSILQVVWHTFSLSDTQSAVSVFNKEGRVICTPLLKDVFDRCYYGFARTKGSYDPTKYPAYQFWNSKSADYVLSPADSLELDVIRKRSIMSGFVEYDAYDSLSGNNLHYLAVEDFHFSLGFNDVMEGILVYQIQKFLDVKFPIYKLITSHIIASHGVPAQINVVGKNEILRDSCLVSPALDPHSLVDGKTAARIKTDICQLYLRGEDALLTLCYANAMLTRGFDASFSFLDYHPEVQKISMVKCE